MKKTQFLGAERSLLAILAGIVLLMSLLIPARFLSVGNLISMAYQTPIIGFLSLGIMVAFLTGGINLAIISTTNFTGIVTILILQAFMGKATADAPLVVSLVALGGGLAAALAVGALCGAMIAYLEIPAFLVTLGMGTLLNGVNIVITRGYTLSGFPTFISEIGNGVVYDIPIPFIIFILVAVLLGFFLRRTRFGVSLYLVGSNPVASRFSNIDIRSIYIREYILSSLFAALTSFVMMGQLNSVKANYAESYLLVAILACFLGGVDPGGGFGRTAGMVIAIFILQIVSTGVNLLRLDPFLTQAMWGFIIILLLAANYLRAGLHEKKRLAAARSEAVAEKSGTATVAPHG
jgi:simple sugar transport system permease protein